MVKPMVLSKLNEWLSSNSVVAGANTLSGIAHAKYLKMQKILLEQELGHQDGAGSNFRLIQLVEMGASTSKYRKSK